MRFLLHFAELFVRGVVVVAAAAAIALLPTMEKMFDDDDVDVGALSPDLTGKRQH